MNENDRLLLEAQRASERGDMGRVIAATDELLKREPDNVDALFLAGIAFMKSGNEGHALQMFNVARAGTKVPHKLAAIWNNIGGCLKDYQPLDAYKAFQKALTFGEPKEVYFNLTLAASQLGRHAEALEWADKSDAIGFGADYNRSFALFALGRWKEAWACYDTSRQYRDGAMRGTGFGLPRWKGPNGGQAPGKVVVHGEQGIGDELLFLSMLPSDFDGVIECNRRNAGLVARSFPKATVYGTLAEPYIDWLEKEGCDYEIEMGGLGAAYGWDKPVRFGPFLEPDIDRLDMCKTYFRSEYTVGIAWTGGAWHTGRSKRSVPFEIISRLFDVPGVTFVNLEYEDRSAELKPFDNVLDPTWATRKGSDMDDLAALVAACDLVIAPTTSVVDLAGGLGVECWAMVDEIPQWRYSDTAGHDRMWFYESVRTFRQQGRDNGKWDRVVGEIRAELLKRTSAAVAAE